MKQGKKAPVIPDGFDSYEEIHFSWWLEELVATGYVKSWRRGENYELVPAVRQEYLKQRVSPHTGKQLPPQIGNNTIKQRLTYTPDFEVVWSLKSLGLFFVFHDPNILMDGPMTYHFLAHQKEYETVSIVEVKPKLGMKGAMNSSRFTAARMNAMFLFDKHGIYANLVEIGTQPKGLFDKTFTPDRFLTTDKSGKPRTLKFQPRGLSGFVEETQKLKPITL